MYKFHHFCSLYFPAIFSPSYTNAFEIRKNYHFDNYFFKVRIYKDYFVYFLIEVCYFAKKPRLLTIRGFFPI